MNCCILYRVNGGTLEAVWDETRTLTTIYEFPDFDAAVAYADRNKLFASGQADYQIVVLDEL